VSDTATVFDPRVPGAFLAPDYFATMAELRRAGPLHRIDDDVYLVPRYADVRAAARDWQRFSSAEGHDLPKQVYRETAITTDPPLHDEYRRLMQEVLNQTTINELQP